MRFGIFTLVSACAFLAACNSATREDFASVQLPARITQMAKDQVKFAMKDPASAQFRGIRGYSFSGPGGGYVVCGMVNGKNSLGGHTGFQPFRTSVGNSQSSGQVYINNIYATAMPC
jgi:hypothetical protein